MHTLPEMSHQAMLDDLILLLGPERVTAESDELRRYRAGPWGYVDPNELYGWTPLLAIRPRTAMDVASSMAIIVKAGFPIIPVTGATGLTGGSLATANSVVVDLAELDEMITIDREGRRAIVSANVRIESLADTARAANLLFAHDPWSAPLATVGGTISTNGVGYLAAGYGTMGNQVLSLRVALTTGVLLDLTRQPATTAGPDLAGLFIGSEGTLGVIVGATVRLFPLPEREQLIGFEFLRFENAFGALNAAIDARLPLAMIDLQETETDPIHTEVMICLHGSSVAVNHAIEKLTRIAAQWSGTTMPDATVLEFWRDRHASADAFTSQRKELLARLRKKGRRPPRVSDSRSSYYLHVSLPAGQVLEYRRLIAEFARSAGVNMSESGIWGIPEFFSFMLHGSPSASTSVAEYAMLNAAQRGGSIEYCHGIGLSRAHLMPRALGVSWDVLRDLKKVLDPSGLLNPGKQGLATPLEA